MIEPTDDDIREAVRRTGDVGWDEEDTPAYVRRWAAKGRRPSMMTLDHASTIAKLRVAVEALEMAKTLMDAIEQTDDNVWHIVHEDPESLCSDTMHGIETALAQIREA